MHAWPSCARPRIGTAVLRLGDYGGASMSGPQIRSQVLHPYRATTLEWRRVVVIEVSMDPYSLVAAGDRTAGLACCGEVSAIEVSAHGSA
jgi:hypothetical protein